MNKCRLTSMFLLNCIFVLNVSVVFASGTPAKTSRPREVIAEPTGKERASRATVSASSAPALTAFATKLRELAGNGPLERKNISCNNDCVPKPSTTETNRMELELTFLRKPQDRMGMLMKAWDHVDQTVGDASFGIKFHVFSIGTVCTNRANCKNAPACGPATSYCDTLNSPGACVACP
jgi:hypothetical protein